MGRHPGTSRRHNRSNRPHGLRRLTSFFQSFAAGVVLALLTQAISTCPSVPGELCMLCDHALESSDSSEDYVLQKPPLVKTFLTTQRPLGVTILALWNYSVALVVLFSGLVFLGGPKALAGKPETLGFPGGNDPDFNAIGFRLLMFGLCPLISYLAYLIGTAFWCCKNWARP
jgi:hypothetical protein